ncbi:MAG: hypothetical protein WDZ49_15155 [Litorilinea sp.]
MTLNRSRRILLALVLAAAMLVPAAIVSAATGPATPPPIAIGPRLKPHAIPHTDVVNVYTAINAPLPPQALEANLADGGRTQEKPGRGIRQTATGIGLGTTLYSTPNVCNNFNTADNWAAKGVDNNKWDADSDIYTDWYMGWAPFAINDGGLYQAKNVVFSRERVVGPGDDHGPNQNSAKIYSGQPYAAGFGSPIIPVPAGFEGGQVMVSANYLIWDHDQGGKEGGKDGLDYDWASLGVKAGAASDQAHYVNGYVRGEWSIMSHTIDLGYAHDVMVLLQGHSPIVANSNIFFDNVTIAFMHGDKVHYLSDCTLEGTVK